MNPFSTPGIWLKSALHVHTTASDGKVTPRQALQAYRGLGYDLVAITDHDRITQVDPPEGMTLLSGAEWGAVVPDSPAGFHFITIGMQGQHGHANDSVTMPPGEAAQIMALRNQPYEMAKLLRGLCRVLIVAHPYWSALTTELLDRLEGVSFLEVYNHGCEVEDGLGYSHYVWDQLLARGKQWNAVAVDDSHWAINDHGGGWVMIKAPDRSAAAVTDALAAGSFYSSAGPVIEDFQVEGRTARVRCSAAASILFRCNGSLGNGMHRAKEGEELTAAEHVLPGRAKFLRAEVTDAQGRKAWTNPIYL
jgi:predicted metal-dependent phosphoesterase TrpH